MHWSLLIICRARPNKGREEELIIFIQAMNHFLKWMRKSNSCLMKDCFVFLHSLPAGNKKSEWLKNSDDNVFAQRYHADKFWEKQASYSRGNLFSNLFSAVPKNIFWHCLPLSKRGRKTRLTKNTIDWARSLHPCDRRRRVDSISSGCEIVMNWQLFGLTRDQPAQTIIAYYFVNETAHKQTAWTPWINLAEL